MKNQSTPKGELDERKPFKCEFGHVQVKKCKFGHPVYAHDSRWCCACEADIAFALSWIQREPEFTDKFISKQELAEALKDEEVEGWEDNAELVPIRNKFKAELRKKFGVE